MDLVPLAPAPQPELSFHPLPGASSKLEQIPEMLRPPSLPQAWDGEAQAGFLQVVKGEGKGGTGHRATPGLSPRTAGGTALVRQAPAPTRITGTLLRRPQSAVAARQRPPRVPGAALHARPVAPGPPSLQARNKRARARETIVAPLARRGPCPSPCPPARSYLWVPAAAERAPTSRERGPYASGRWGAGSRDAQNRSLTPRPARRDLGGGGPLCARTQFPPSEGVRACLCVCVGGRGGRVPPQSTTSPKPGRVEGAGGRGTAAADRPGCPARGKPARSRCLCPTHLKIPK